MVLINHDDEGQIGEFPVWGEGGGSRDRQLGTKPKSPNYWAFASQTPRPHIGIYFPVSHL